MKLRRWPRDSKLPGVYHVDLRSGVHAARAFNLSGEELERRFAAPMRAGRTFSFEDREWEPKDTRMTVYEAEQLRPDQIGMGRGWQTVQKLGSDVTAQVLAAAVQTAAAPAGPSTHDPLRERLIGRLAAGPVTLPEIISIAAALDPDATMEEHAGASAQAIWELLRQGSAQLSASDR